MIRNLFGSPIINWDNAQNIGLVKTAELLHRPPYRSGPKTGPSVGPRSGPVGPNILGPAVRSKKFLGPDREPTENLWTEPRTDRRTVDRTEKKSVRKKNRNKKNYFKINFFYFLLQKSIGKSKIYNHV